MRKKELKLIVAFHTITDSMAMEKVCKENEISGRLIPLPREISAGCGLAWCSDIRDREAVCNIMEENGIENTEVRECLVATVQP